MLANMQGMNERRPKVEPLESLAPELQESVGKDLKSDALKHQHVIGNRLFA